MLPRTLLITCALTVALTAVLTETTTEIAHAQGGPVIEDVEPTSGPPGTLVRVSGRRFGKDASVSLGGTVLPIVERLPNRLSVRVADGVASGHLALSGENGAVRGPEFRVTPASPAPKIDALEPVKGAPGTRVMLRGKNFSPLMTANSVTLGGRPVLLRSATPTALEITVPAGASSGPFVVRVDQGGEAQSQSFQVLSPVTIDAVSPARAAPHGELEIRGQGFSPVADKNRVYLGNLQLKVKTASERELVVTLPGNPASGELLIDVEGGGRVAAADHVLVQLPPKVASFAPRSAVAGSVITVRGTSFGTDPAAIEAKLGDKPLTVRSAKGTVLEVEVPAGARTGRFSIRVHGVGPAWSEQDFIVDGVVAIKSVAPEAGPVASELIIEGEGFAKALTANRVRIGGKVAQVVEASETKLRVKVPDGDGGKVSVEVQGAGTATAARPFAITRAD